MKALVRLLAACAALFSVLLLMAADRSRRTAQPVHLADSALTAMADGPRRVGSPDAPVEIVEFVDYQCSACRAAHQELSALVADAPSRFTVVIRQRPLSRRHPHAVAASVAAVCAARQGRFHAFHDSLYAQQAFIGLKAWKKIAAEAGVPDLAAFESCRRTDEAESAVAMEVRLAEQYGIVATPTIVIGGRMYVGFGREARAAVAALRAAR